MDRKYDNPMKAVAYAEKKNKKEYRQRKGSYFRNMDICPFYGNCASVLPVFLFCVANEMHPDERKA